MVGKINETITWIRATEKPSLPAAVLCWLEDEYFCGWWEAERDTWIDFSAAPVQVAYWCEIAGPEGLRSLPACERAA